MAAVHRRLPPAERAHASVFTSNYGGAGAVALYGPAEGLPDPISGHNTYGHRGPGTAPDRVVVDVGDVGSPRIHFDRCRRAATVHSPEDVDNDEDGTGIWICTGPHGTWRSFWGDVRHDG